MNRSKNYTFSHFALAAGFLLAIGTVNASPMNVDRATEVAQDSKCFKCHGVDKKKDGPAWKDVAAKYRDAKWTGAHKPGEDKATVIHHITSGEEVKFEDGHKEEHKKLKVDNDAEVNGFAEWLLSL